MDRHDVMTLTGLGLLAVGLWMYSPALAFVIIGLIVLAVGIYGASK